MWKPFESFDVPQPIQSVSDTQQMPLGAIIRACEPLHGFGEFIYLAGAASMAAGDLVTYDPSSGATTRGAAAANTGLPIAFAAAPVGANQFGWFQVSGVALANNNGTAAAGAAFQVATASITSSATAGKQVLGGCRILTANNSTFTKKGTTRAGSTEVVVADLDGLYVGLAVSGTGIAANSTIASGVDGSPSARSAGAGGAGSINLNNAATADGTVTLTFTRSNASLVGGQRYFAQGQIT